MKTLTADLTRTELYTKTLDGTDALGQASRILDLIEIVTDAFNCTYQSLYFRTVSKHTRFNISALQTAFQFVTKDLINGLIDASRTGEHFNWEAFELHEAISDASYDVDTYLEYSSATIAIFDCFFNHDSMKGESPEEFIELTLHVRNFFLHLLSVGLRDGIDRGYVKQTIIYPNSQETRQDAASV